MADSGDEELEFRRILESRLYLEVRDKLRRLLKFLPFNYKYELNEAAEISEQDCIKHTNEVFSSSSPSRKDSSNEYEKQLKDAVKLRRFQISRLFKSTKDAMFDRKIFIRFAQKDYRLIKFTFFFYLSLRLLIAGYLLYRYDLSLKHLNPRVKSNATTSSECAKREDIYYREGADMDQYLINRLYLFWLNALGIVPTSLTGTSVIAAFALGLVPLILYVMFVTCYSNEKLSVDHLNFIINPIHERNRLRGDLNRIIEEVSEELATRVKNCWFGSNEYQINEEPTQRLLYPNLQNKKFSSRSCHNSIGKVYRIYELDRMEKTRCIKMILSIKKLDLMKPCISSSEWHKNILLITKFATKFSTLTFLYIPLIFAIWIYIMDIRENIQHRLSLIECQQWNSNGTLVRMEDVAISATELSSKDIEKYTTFDGSLIEMANLFLFVETKYYFSWRRMTFITEVAIAIFSMEIWISLLFINFYVIASVNKIIWLKQLRIHLGSILTLTRKLANRIDKKDSIRDWSIMEDRILLDLTISYLNFELFRRQQNRFLMMANILIMANGLVSGCILTLVYSVANNLKIKHIDLVTYVIIAVMMTTNILMLLSSYIGKILEKITKDVDQILAHCSRLELENSYPVELWRRYDLSSRETRNLFAASLFGTYISYEKVVQFNAYLVAYFLSLARSRARVVFTEN